MMSKDINTYEEHEEFDYDFDYVGELKNEEVLEKAVEDGKRE